MGFKQPSLEDAQNAVRRVLIEIHSPHNDGWSQMACKKDLYLLKCWLEDRYEQLPQFGKEDEWEQERLIEKLKR